MPIRLYTGLPGNGKTAYFMQTLFEMELAKVKRKIYICGIELLKEFELNIEIVTYEQVKGWENFEEGSLIVIDEAQHSFPTRSASKEVPSYIKGLSEHRHGGFDFVMLTQDPRNLDAYARRLINEHRHIKRLFGSAYQAAFIWDSGAKDNPVDKQNQRDCIKKVTKLPKHVFGSYVSAVEHTIKRKVPKALYLALVFIIGFPVIAYFMLKNAPPDVVDTKIDAPNSSPLKGGLSTKINYVDKPTLFIDQDLLFLDGMRLGKHLSITLVLIQNGYETRLGISDLQLEEGLQYSLLSNNKLILKQKEKRRVLYRVIRSEPKLRNTKSTTYEKNRGLGIPF